MITREELLLLLDSTETYRVEKTISTTNMDKFCEAICAFANDMPNSKKNGYLLIGVNDDGSRSGLKVTDELLQKISAIRTDGNILPLLRRCFVGSQTVVIASGGNRDPQQILIVVNRLNNGTQEQKELGVFVRRITGRQQIHTGICGDGPVVVLTGTVDTGKGLLMEQAD